jgi:phosphate:Na+ symporter
MTNGLLTLCGGVGLFLLGMRMLSDGLRAMAGAGLREVLARFTRTPARGAAAGTVATAALQSSSAVTVMTVGFVGAGLMTFPQAVGVILGANIGTTLTGWVVAVVGFKMQLGLMALPLLLAGVLARMFARGRAAQAGWALAGFSLIFIGIDMLQAGMAGFEGAVTPASFPDDTVWGRAQLALIGLAATVAMQSSSAAIATALAAMTAGAIDFPQAAAMVIGMNVGTTVTVALVSLGGSTAMRRTALAHVLFNVMTGAVAFAILDPFTALMVAVTPGEGVGEAQLALVGFHSVFNVVGVAAVLPFAGVFARAVERLAPERGPALARRLDGALTADPAAAADAAAATAADIWAVLAGVTAKAANEALDPARTPRDMARTIEAAAQATAAAQGFVERAAAGAAPRAAQTRLAACLNVLDHLARQARRAAQTDRAGALARDRRLRRIGRALAAAMADPGNAGRFERLHALTLRQRERLRRALLREAAAGRLGAAETGRRLDALRWAQRCAYHGWRIALHLRTARGAGR